MATHSQHNNVEGTAVVSEHNKRVSFGAEEHVQMIVYDDGLNDDYSIQNNNSRQHLQQAASRHTFTEPDAPPSRVRVHAEQAEIPRPISPPAQIFPVPVDAGTAHGSTAAAATSSASAQPPATATTAAASVGVQSPHTMVQMVNSPPLPSFMKRAEHDNENPFRPDEQLYHEVDPIVEMYRQRPFPPSPSQGSPVPPHQQQQQQPTPSRQTQTQSRSTTPNRGTEVVANGGGGQQQGGRHSSLAEARREAQTANQQQHQPLIDSTADGIGPPGRAEVVRLPEKKKRACCSLQ